MSTVYLVERSSDNRIWEEVFRFATRKEALDCFRKIVKNDKADYGWRGGRAIITEPKED